MRKKRDKTNFKFSNRLHYTLVVIVSIILLGVGVYAIQTSAPGTNPNPGHNLSQVAPPAGCTDGQFLQYDSGAGGHAWICATPVSGGTNYWTDSGAFVETTSGDSVGATQYCDENGANCFEASKVANAVQCPPYLTFVHDSTPGDDEYARRGVNCRNYVASDSTPYIVMSGPGICDNYGTSCEHIRSGYADAFCMEFGLRVYSGQSSTSSYSTTYTFTSLVTGGGTWNKISGTATGYSTIACYKADI